MYFTAFRGEWQEARCLCQYSPKSPRKSGLIPYPSCLDKRQILSYTKFIQDRGAALISTARFPGRSPGAGKETPPKGPSGACRGDAWAVRKHLTDCHWVKSVERYPGNNREIRGPSPILILLITMDLLQARGFFRAFPVPIRP